MKIGCAKEIKPQEFRVGITPNAALEAVSHGHKVLIETGAGVGAGFDDSAYEAAGANILSTAQDVFAQADMIVKVKEPQAVERKMLREGQLLFTYLHLAPDPEQTHDLIESGATCIAYETVTDRSGGLPLLAPMSEVAGRLAPQVGAWTLQKANGGRGVLMGGVPGVGPARVAVIGGGVVGTHAARIAAGMGAGRDRTGPVTPAAAVSRRCLWWRVQDQLCIGGQHHRTGQPGRDDHRRRAGSRGRCTQTDHPRAIVRDETRCRDRRCGD